MTYPDAFTRQLGPGGLELRALPADSAMIAAAEDSGAPIIRGYGSVSNVWTTIGGDEWGFDEMFEPGAWTESIKTADVRSMFNHECEWLLGRTKSGTLRLAEDSVGLGYEVDINEADVNAMSVHAKVARGDVDGSSVWFRCIEDAWVYPDATNNLARPQRRIITAALVETGPVTFPAYEEAESTARSLRPFDAVLRAAGVNSDHKRAMFAADLLSDPESAEKQLRTLFARSPELREAVCSCDTRSGPAAAAAPEPQVAASAQEPTVTRSADLAIAKARLDLLAKTPA